ncbi:c-type cytochrome [Alcaligenes sp. SDU_A2]|uniref:c-type cytochrome n=1 Tax=Alcaligenes sp. SDU_A2 TaxID=3136634 RepID=UPI002C7AA1FE|nr:c-type cytochrome [Alcaligenes sp.]
MTRLACRTSCLLLVVLCVLAGFNPAAKADTVSIQTLLQTQCLSCHQMDRKRVGPPFMDVARRYAQGDRAAAQRYLEKQIRQGSRGNWGAIPMPAQNRVNAEQARAIAAWLLNLTDTSTKESP